jgi:hypothetical protein
MRADAELSTMKKLDSSCNEYRLRVSRSVSAAYGPDPPVSPSSLFSVGEVHAEAAE